jgi:hypothetical protein
VGWWDAEESEWKTDGISDVVYNTEAHTLAFHTNKLTSLALITSRIKLLPFASWLWRPEGPSHGARYAHDPSPCPSTIPLPH